MFTQNDINQIKGHGLSVETVEKQIENFRTGFPSLPIVPRTFQLYQKALLTYHLISGIDRGGYRFV